MHQNPISVTVMVKKAVAGLLTVIVLTAALSYLNKTNEHDWNGFGDTDLLAYRIGCYGSHLKEQGQ